MSDDLIGGIAINPSGGGTPASSVTGPDAYNSPSVVGVSTAYARADHDHGLPAANAASLTNLYSALTATQALTAATALNVLSVALTPGTWIVSGQATVQLTTAGPCDIALTGGPAVSSATMHCGAINQSFSANVDCIMVITANTTVYLTVDPAQAGTVEFASQEGAYAGATSISAVKIA